MKQKEPLKIFTHQYPKWLFNHPQWILIIYLSNYLTQLRKWHIAKRLKKLLARKTDSFSLLDVGCGEGQFLFPYAAVYTKSFFKGLDRAESNVSFCKQYAKVQQYAHVDFEQIGIESFHESDKYDISLCLSVLPYCINDNIALAQLYKSMKTGGELLLYVPVNNTILLPFYKRIISQYDNYESLQKNQKTYTELSIKALLTQNHFTITETKYTYGFWGKLSNELLNSHFILFNAYVLPLKIIVLISFIILYPLILLCMILDFLLPVVSGNGIMIVAKK
ncbi:MAG: methyltransferase domain-containing protein [Chitinophagaceae bacterium]|nr:methyltransferase domain-containing protein [Chitinophagaceae bacterium]